MTGQASRPSVRKRLLAISLLSAVVLLTAWIANFLLSFDLNDYRQQAEERLSALFAAPVKIDDLHFNVHDTNLALKLSGLAIGDEDSGTQIDAEVVLLNLQWRALLKREIRFAKISLERPQIRISPGSGAPGGTAGMPAEALAAMLDQDLLQKARIGKLEVVDGALRVDLPRPGQAAGPIVITALNGELAGLRLNGVAKLSLQGQLRLPQQGSESSWQLKGSGILARQDLDDLLQDFMLDLQVSSLDLNALLTLFADPSVGVAIAGNSDLKLHLAGKTADAIDFRTEFSAGEIALSAGPAVGRPIVLKKLLASGQLNVDALNPGISGLALEVDGSRLTGDLRWTPRGQPFAATASLAGSTLSVPWLKQWLPTTQEPGASFRQKLLDQGTLLIERGQIALRETPETRHSWSVETLKGELQNVSWAFSDVHSVEMTALPFEFTGSSLRIDNAQVQIGGLRLAVEGSGTYAGNRAVLNSLDFSGDALPEVIREEWALPATSLATTGQIGFKGHLEGPANQLSLDLVVDLSRLSASHPDGVKISPGPEDKLALHGIISPDKITLEHGAIKWAAAKGHLTGSFFPGKPEALSIEALLSIDDLARLAEIAPALEKWQIHGQADLKINQQGLPAEHRPEVTLTLRDAGMHATRFIADLSQINGRVRLTATGMSADNLRIHLGQSPLTVQARIEDFGRPRLLLDVQAPSIRADELIFSSEQAHLRDIRGHLEIDGDGLAFNPVDVRLDGGTQATVRGTISFHPPFAVDLDITSEFARIGEVIGLWTERRDEGPVTAAGGDEEIPAGEAQAPPSVRIRARASQGDLYGMSFHDASGLIVPSHRRLVIHPLDFSVGEGFCNAQVITDFSDVGPSMLRISGHAEDVDALEVYRELLNQKNIVRGRLRGDFYLVGETGANYLPSSYGRFSIQVHEGVLHQFQFLSKVFSLLNVSQIFALELPDMDREGMPFKTLSANFELDKGILGTEDLRIQSEAMNQSYIGHYNLIDKEVDMIMAVHPLGTVDKIVSRIPVAGWLLAGDDRALLTAHFAIRGKTDDVSVETMPLDTLSEPTIGLLKRTLQLPFKLLEDPQIIWGGESTAE